MLTNWRLPPESSSPRVPPHSRGGRLHHPCSALRRTRMMKKHIQGLRQGLGQTADFRRTRPDGATMEQHTIQPDLASERPKTDQRFQQGGLAGGIWTAHTNDRPGRDGRQRQARQNGVAAVARGQNRDVKARVHPCFRWTARRATSSGMPDAGRPDRQSQWPRRTPRPTPGRPRGTPFMSTA
jgi:hypothetical protein